jgi:two-component system cell cycle response regulator CpdR
MAQKIPLSHADVVLIVDDDEAILEIAAEFLETLGYNVLTAGSGPAAIERLRPNPSISVLFTDIQMPGMGGEELAEIALMLRPGIRVVFTSGFQTPPGVTAFVPKPFRAVDLIRVLPPQALPTQKTGVGTT